MFDSACVRVGFLTVVLAVTTASASEQSQFQDVASTNRRRLWESFLSFAKVPLQTSFELAFSLDS